MENSDLRHSKPNWGLRATLNALAIGLDAPDSYEMTLQDMWHNGAKRLLLVLIGISVVILLIVGSVAAGIFYMSFRLDKINMQVSVVSAKQEEMVGQVKGNVDAIAGLTDSVNEGWNTFQKSAPTLPVPQIADEVVGKPEVLIKPPIAKSKPTQTPKVKTVIKYKSRPKPTPAPWFRWKK
jgi:hypothetical protein